MNISSRFGKRVKQIRLNKDMSQGDLAKKLDVDPSYISKIERGVQNISLKGIEKLAKTLNIAVKELIK